MEQWFIRYSESLQYIIFFGLFAGLGAAEAFWPVRGGVQRKGRWTANLALTAINIVVMGMLPVTFFGAATWARTRGLGLLNQWAMPAGLFIVLNLAGRGFISFITHFAMHKIPMFWRVHRVHHLDTELDISTTVRFHPLEFAIALVPGIPLVIALGLSPWVLLAYDVLDAALTIFSHANITLPRWIERPLRYLFVTPDLHRIHHSSFQPETDSNFSAVFPVWDVIFGTFRKEGRASQDQMELGLEEVRDQRTKAIGWLLASPFGDLAGEPKQKPAVQS